MLGLATAFRRIENLGKNAKPGIVRPEPGKSFADPLPDQRAFIEEKIGEGRDRGDPRSAAALAQDMHAHLAGQVDELRADAKHPCRGMNRRNHRFLLAPASPLLVPRAGF
jgi:hypothetical protein